MPADSSCMRQLCRGAIQDRYVVRSVGRATLASGRDNLNTIRGGISISLFSVSGRRPSTRYSNAAREGAKLGAVALVPRKVGGCEGSVYPGAGHFGRVVSIHPHRLSVPPRIKSLSSQKALAQYKF